MTCRKACTCACVHVSLSHEITCMGSNSDWPWEGYPLSHSLFICPLQINTTFLAELLWGLEKILHIFSVFCIEPGPQKVLSEWQQSFQRKALRIAFPQNYVNKGSFERSYVLLNFTKLSWLYDLKKKNLQITLKMWRSWGKLCYSLHPKSLIFTGLDKSKKYVREEKVNQTDKQQIEKKSHPPQQL